MWHEVCRIYARKFYNFINYFYKIIFFAVYIAMSCLYEYFCYFFASCAYGI